MSTSAVAALDTVEYQRGQARDLLAPANDLDTLEGEVRVVNCGGLAKSDEVLVYHRIENGVDVDEGVI